VSPTWVTFAFEAANFALLAALLAWIFFRPVRAALERRRSQLEGEARAAAAAHEQAERERAAAIAQRSAQQAELEASRTRLRAEAEPRRRRCSRRRARGWTASTRPSSRSSSPCAARRRVR
jgi:F0F1-type ATP synthase membrane subunit b/b'